MLSPIPFPGRKVEWIHVIIIFVTLAVVFTAVTFAEVRQHDQNLVRIRNLNAKFQTLAVAECDRINIIQGFVDRNVLIGASLGAVISAHLNQLIIAKVDVEDAKTLLLNLQTLRAEITKLSTLTALDCRKSGLEMPPPGPVPPPPPPTSP